jgi:hypothetical protein
VLLKKAENLKTSQLKPRIFFRKKIEKVKRGLNQHLFG